MSGDARLTNAVKRLRQTKDRLRDGKISLPVWAGVEYKEGGEYKEEVLLRFHPVFSPERLPSLSEEEFRSFLAYRNNRHWSGLERIGSRICEDMPGLRSSLQLLLDESQPIQSRYDRALTRVKYFRRAAATPILHIVYPTKYGVWNNKVEAVMSSRLIAILPAFQPSESEGSKYVKVNNLLLQLAMELNIDLWTLDVLWWAFIEDHNGDL